MRLSVFTPLGLLRLSAEKPLAERIYTSLVASLGKQFSTEEGALMDAHAFASARGMARLSRDTRRAALQGVPSQTGGLLPEHEKMRGIIPDPNATMADRRAELAARSLLPLGSSQANLEAALSSLLGSDLLAVHTTAVADVVLLSQADGGDVKYERPDVPRKVIRVDEPMSLPGAGTQWFEYTVIAGTQGTFSGQLERLVPGDRVNLDTGRLGCAETVEVTDVVPPGGGQPEAFRCEYTLPHDDGTIGFTHPLPMESTDKRHVLVVLSAAAAGDPQTRRQIDELMRRAVRDVTTWSIVAGSGGLTQQFQVAVASIGISHATPISY